MKSLLIIIFCIWSFQIAFGQDYKIELNDFLRSSFSVGEHSFYLMRNTLKESKKSKKFKTDENGEILNPKKDFLPFKDNTVFEFIPSGNIKLTFKLSGSLLIIRPLENCSCPTIKIDMNSLKADIGEIELQEITKVAVNNNKNSFNSAWKGFQWNTDSSKSSSLVKSRLTLGKILENHKIYIEIIWFEKGRKMHYRLMS